MAREKSLGDIWGANLYGDSDELDRPTPTQVANGLIEAQYPTREWINWLYYLATNNLEWIESEGLFEWDAGITYRQYGLTISAGIHYISLQDANTNNTPASEPTWWQNLYDWLIAQAGKTLTVANEAALGTGVVDGQIRGTADGNIYTWNDGDTMWDGRDGNSYATTPAFGNVQFKDGAIATINKITERYDGSAWQEVATATIGRFDRPEFGANASSTQIDLKGPAGYHLDGKGWIWWTGTLAYNFTTLTASTWSYLYLDESSISGPGAITNSNLIDSTTAPTYDSTKGGWYNGLDRCVFMVYGTGASSYRFYRQRDDFIQYEERFVDINNVAVGTGGTSYALTVPAIVRQALVTFFGIYQTANATILWREAGSSSNGHVATRGTSTSTDVVNQEIVDLDSSQQVNIFSTAAGCNLTAYTDGFFLPKGV